jgi:hypothetical protein
LYIPQVISGGVGVLQEAGFTTDVVIVNHSTTTVVEGAVEFHLLNGEPWLVGLANLVARNGVILQATDTNRYEFVIQPLGSVTLTTDGAGVIDETLPDGLGSAKILTDGPVGAVARLKTPDGGSLSGFGASDAFDGAIGPVRRLIKIDGPGDLLNTAFAVRNTSDDYCTVTMELLDETGETPGTAGGGVIPGQIPSVAQVELAPNARVARFIDEFITGIDTSDFSGTLVITSEDGAFAAIALEQLGGAAGVFSSLPVVPLDVPKVGCGGN